MTTAVTPDDKPAAHAAVSAANLRGSGSSMGTLRSMPAAMSETVAGHCRSLLALQFDWLRGAISDMGATAGKAGPSPEDCMASWMGFAIRQQLRAASLSQEGHRSFKTRFHLEPRRASA